MTKEMHEKCLNKDMAIYGKLPKDVKAEINRSRNVNILDMDGNWEFLETPMWCFSSVYRIDPSTPYDPVFEEKDVIFTPNGVYGVDFGRRFAGTISAALCHPNCLGIIYEKDGEETLRTSVDLAFGTPKRVRFAK